MVFYASCKNPWDIAVNKRWRATSGFMLTEKKKTTQVHMPHPMPSTIFICHLCTQSLLHTQPAPWSALPVQSRRYGEICRRGSARTVWQPVSGIYISPAQPRSPQAACTSATTKGCVVLTQRCILQQHPPEQPTEGYRPLPLLDGVFPTRLNERAPARFFLPP